MNRQQIYSQAGDAELVRLAQAGETSAFTALVARYQDRVFNTCLRLCCNQADAADLAQNTFLRALESLSQFRASSGFFTWLYRIAVNHFVAQRRSERRRSELLAAHIRTDARLRSDDHDAPVPGAQLEQRELHARLERALARLDEEFRVAVVLRDVEDLDYDQIAEIVGVPVGTVKSRIHRGRMMLREMLSDEVRTPLGNASL